MALKEARLKAGLSQSQLANLASINLRMLQYYEQGKNDINKAQVQTLLKLCKALNCSLADIITDEETLALIEELNM